jgi:hypothetical protein
MTTQERSGRTGRLNRDSQASGRTLWHEHLVSRPVLLMSLSGVNNCIKLALHESETRVGTNLYTKACKGLS